MFFTEEISIPKISKVRKMEVVEEEESLLNRVKEMLKQVLEESRQKAKLKCFHFKEWSFPKKL